MAQRNLSEHRWELGDYWQVMLWLLLVVVCFTWGKIETKRTSLLPQLLIQQGMIKTSQHYGGGLLFVNLLINSIINTIIRVSELVT